MLRESIRNIMETNLIATLDVSLAVARHTADERAGHITMENIVLDGGATFGARQWLAGS